MVTQKVSATPWETAEHTIASSHGVGRGESWSQRYVHARRDLVAMLHERGVETTKGRSSITPATLCGLLPELEEFAGMREEYVLWIHWWARRAGTYNLRRASAPVSILARHLIILLAIKSGNHEKFKELANRTFRAVAKREIKKLKKTSRRLDRAIRG